MGRQAGKYGPGGKVVQGCVPERILKAWKQADYNQKAAMLSLVEAILLGRPSESEQLIEPQKEKKGPGRPSTKTEEQKEQDKQNGMRKLHQQRQQAKAPHMPPVNPALEAEFGRDLDEYNANLKQTQAQTQTQEEEIEIVDEEQYDYSHLIQGEPCSKEEISNTITEIGKKLKRDKKSEQFIRRMTNVTQEKAKEKWPHLYEKYTKFDFNIEQKNDYRNEI